MRPNWVYLLIYLAHNGNKKVFIIDFDIEAPAFNNFFGNTNGSICQIGLIEYLTEKTPCLMELWRYRRYNRIFGKLFLRRDLFRKMKGLTNVKDIENQAIDIEWKREEVYSYFFKTILYQDIILRFWGVCYLMTPAEYPRIKQQMKHYGCEENRFKLDNYFLRPLVDSFFGMTVKTKEIGNSPIRAVLEFFKNHIQFKYIRLSRSKFEEALAMLLSEDANENALNDQDIKSLTDLMITNGIISKSSNVPSTTLANELKSIFLLSFGSKTFACMDNSLAFCLSRGTPSHFE